MMMTMSDQVKSIEAISDTELIRRLEKLNVKEREATLSFLLHLNEVDRRRLHLSKGYKSLFDYCVRRFHYSESAANRRIRTARCIRDFPEVYGMLSLGELSLCTVTQIAGILRRDNSKRLLSEVRNRSMREVGMIVSRHCPGSACRDRMRPVYIKRYIPVSELQDHAGAGEAAADADTSGVGLKLSGDQAVQQADASGAGLQIPRNQAPRQAVASGAGLQLPGNQAPRQADTSVADLLPLANSTPQQAVEGGKKFTASAGGNEVNTVGGEVSGGNARDIVDLMVFEKRFEFKFTVNPGCMEKLERVRSLLSNRYPRRLELGRLLDILLDEYLDRHSPEGRIRRREIRKAKKNRDPQGHKQRDVKTKETKAKRATGISDGKCQREKKRSRRIPQSVRDEVFARDRGRCTFVGKDGARCEATDYLQIDHIVPFARGGDNSASNLRLLCTDHNRLAAEVEYGKDFMKKFYRREWSSSKADQ